MKLKLKKKKKMALSEFERKRQENIKRNQELLSKLNLDSISNNISKEIERSSASPQPQKNKKRALRSVSGRVAKKEEQAKKVVEPARRSRRIAGIQSEQDNPEEYAKHRAEEEARERRKREYEELKRTKLFGDFNLIDLVTDKKHGEMVFESKVRNNSNNSTENGSNKSYDGDNDKVKIESDENRKNEDVDVDNLIHENNEVLKLMQSLGDRFSAGDFYEQIKKNAPSGDKSVDAKRKEFDSKTIFPKYDPLQIGITHKRITAINFHPAVEDRIVAAGDTNGNLGLWAPDSSSSSDDAEPSITILRPHGKNISKIVTPRNHLEKLYSASYDGSVRSLDLNKLSSSEVVSLNDSYGSDYGISDMNISSENPNLLYLSTLEGVFTRIDIREKPRDPEYLRLHDKKIGGFAINPQALYQIATSSLDRSMRIWDLRKVNSLIYSEYEDQRSPHMYGNYTSRLSISTVGWNSENRLVCNGYDDQICIFNYNKSPEITLWSDDFMPDYKRTSRKQSANEDEIVLPNNLLPVNKIKHNCQTGRWVSILKARWQEDPQDGVQKFIIGNMKRGMDVFDQEGNILGHLNDNMGAVPAVCSLHPTQNWAVGGSASGKIYLIE